MIQLNPTCHHTIDVGLRLSIFKFGIEFAVLFLQAAGLLIANVLPSQITQLNQGVNNANEGCGPRAGRFESRFDSSFLFFVEIFD